MIEPTDEMRTVFLIADQGYRQAELDRLGLNALHLPTLDAGAFTAGLAAVLAVVERDYDVRPRQPAEAGATRKPGEFPGCTSRTQRATLST